MCVRAAEVQLRASRLCQNKRKKQFNQDDYLLWIVPVRESSLRIDYYAMGTAI